MNLTGLADSSHDLSLLKNAGLGEVILGMREFSRFGKLDEKSFPKLAADATRLGMRVIFEWDILMTEDVFRKCVDSIGPWLELSDVIRVQDPGAYHWALHHTNLPVQFIAESGNHNLEALLGWCEAGKNRLERIVLSIELSRESI
jgi:putative protease